MSYIGVHSSEGQIMPSLSDASSPTDSHSSSLASTRGGADVKMLSMRARSQHDGGVHSPTCIPPMSDDDYEAHPLSLTATTHTEHSVSRKWIHGRRTAYVCLFLCIFLFLLTKSGMYHITWSSGSRLGRYKRARHMAILSLLSAEAYYKFQFWTLLYPSFVKLSSDAVTYRKSDSIIDLIIYCHPETCPELHKHSICTPLDDDPFFHGSPGNSEVGGNVCRTVPYVAAFANYPFLKSVEFMNMAMQDERLRGTYTYIMRTDVDAVLFPLLRTLVPRDSNYVVIAGHGFNGIPYTKDRLAHVAKRYQLPYHNFHDMFSTTIVHCTIAYKFYNHLINLTRRFFEEEFTNAKCARSYFTDSSPKFRANEYRCHWPAWHQGVSSMYATNLVFNAAADNGNVYEEHNSTDSEVDGNAYWLFGDARVWISDAVDYWATQGNEYGALRDVAHAHFLKNKRDLWQVNGRHFCEGTAMPPWFHVNATQEEDARFRSGASTTVGEYVSGLLRGARAGYWCTRHR